MNRIAKMTVWITICIASVLSFFMFTVLDDELPAGTSTAFEISRVDTGNKEQALSLLQKTAEKYKINIYKISAADGDSLRSRRLFVFIGDREGFDRQGAFDYPVFSPSTMKTEVRAAADISTEDLRGSYAANASSSQLRAIMSDLASHRITMRIDVGTWIGALLYSLGVGSLGAPLAIGALALIVALSYSISSNRKIHAIKSLHGYNARQILAAELADFLRVFALGLLGVAIVGLPFLWFYNHFNQLTRFLLTAGGILLGLLVFSLVLIVALGGASTLRDRIALTIDGEGTRVGDGIMAGVVQVIVLALIFGTASGSLNRLHAVSQTRKELSQWSLIPDAYLARFSLESGTEEEIDKAGEFMTVIRRMDDEGKVLEAYSNDPPSSQEGWDEIAKDPLMPYENNGYKSMIVNPTYLRLIGIRDSHGKTMRETDSQGQRFSLLIPDSYRGDVDELLASYVRSFDEMCQEELKKGRTTRCHPEGTVVRTRSGQRLPAFRGTDFEPAEDQQIFHLDDPIVAVVSTSSGLQDGLDFVAANSQGHLLFFDADELDRRLTQAGIRDQFQAIDRAEDSIMSTLAITQREQTGDLIGLALGAFAVVLATLVCAAVYCEKRRRVSFVELIHGYGFFRRHRAFLAGEFAACVAALLAVAVLGHMFTWSDLGIAVGLLAMAAALTLSSIGIYEHRFQAADIKRP